MCFTLAFYHQNLTFPENLCLWIHVTLGQTKNELVLSQLISVTDWSNQRLVSAPYIHLLLNSRVIYNQNNAKWLWNNAFKRIFRKRVFEFIWIELHQLQSAFTSEKNAFSIIILALLLYIQSLRGVVVKDQSSIIADSEGVSSNPDEAILLNFVHFLLWLVFLYSHCWSYKDLRGFCNNILFLVIKCDKSRRLALRDQGMIGRVCLLYQLVS